MRTPTIMRTFTTAIAAMLAFLEPISATPLLATGALPDGRTGEIGPWSIGTPIELASDSGPRLLTSHFSYIDLHAADRQNGQTEHTVIQALVNAEGAVVWLGPSGGKQFSLAGRIYGVYGRDMVVDFLPAATPQNSGVTLSLTLATVGDLVWRNPSILQPGADLTGEVPSLSLPMVFGGYALDQRSAHKEHAFVSLIGVTMHGKESLLSFRNDLGQELILGLGANLRVESALVGTNSLMIIQDARLPLRVAGWTFPHDVAIESQNGLEMGRSVSRNYVARNPEGDFITVERGLRIVVSRGRGFWIGPTRCRLAAIGQRLIGLEMRDWKELFAYWGELTPGPIPSGSKLTDFVEQQAKELEDPQAAAKLLAGVHVDLSGLGTRFPEVIQSESVDIEDAISDKDSLVLVLHANRLPGQIRVRLDSSLKVVEIFPR